MTRQPSRNSTRPDPDSLFRKALAMQQAGDLRAAVKGYQKLLKRVPHHLQGLGMCAMAKAGLGDTKAAVAMLERLVAAKPGFADAWNNLGVLRQQRGDNAGAAQAYAQVRRLRPEAPLGHLNYANVCQLLEKYDEAVAAYEAALAIAPEEPRIWSNLGRACLFLGDWERALEAADRTLALSPGHTGALALRTDALLELGRDAEWAELVDFDRLIMQGRFAPPAGYSDIESFNAALCAHCLEHPSLAYEPGENTTRKGHQTRNLAQDDNPGPIRQLRALIDAAVRDYQAAHPPDPAHPFLAQRPARWHHDIWGTVLGSQGHQAPHLHRSGWLSGCYYARVPGVITDDADGQAGWIEFGRPQDFPHAKAKPAVRGYQPREGMVVLFPSYFYHRTVPFESSDLRISIAFDIVPL